MSEQDTQGPGHPSPHSASTTTPQSAGSKVTDGSHTSGSGARSSAYRGSFKQLAAKPLKVLSPLVLDKNIRELSEVCLLSASNPGAYRIMMSGGQTSSGLPKGEGDNIGSEINSADEEAFATILSFLFTDVDLAEFVAAAGQSGKDGKNEFGVVGIAVCEQLRKRMR